MLIPTAVRLMVHSDMRETIVLIPVLVNLQEFRDFLSTKFESIFEKCLMMWFGFLILGESWAGFWIGLIGGEVGLGF